MNQTSAIASVAAAGAFPLPQGNLYRLFAGYQAKLTGVLSGASATDNIIIQADADFVIQYLTSTVISNNAVLASPLATVQITDTRSNATLFDEPVPLLSVFGSAQLPFILPSPYRVVRSSTLVVTVNNLNSAAAVDYYLNFLGTKLYQSG
jgi:hypothetical protein